MAADVWSVTSYNELRREALKTERWNMLHPVEAAKVPYIQQVLGGTEGPIVAASDYMKSVQDQVSPWLGGRMVALGTDGFGRSDNRAYLRGHFEVNAASIAVAALSRLARTAKLDAKKAAKAIGELGLNWRRRTWLRRLLRRRHVESKGVVIPVEVRGIGFAVAEIQAFAGL